MPNDLLDGAPSPGSSIEDAIENTDNNKSSTTSQTEKPKPNKTDESDSSSYSNTEQSSSKVVSSKKGDKLNPERVKIFFIKLAKAAKRHQARYKAHNELLSHAEKIKTHVAKSKHPHVEKHISELKQKMQHVVESEKSYPEKYKEKHMQAKINELEKKLSILMQSKIAKEQRFTKLEQKINRKLSADKEILRELEQKVMVLHKKIREQTKKKNSPKNKKDLKDLKERMVMTQNAIQKLKQTPL